MFSLWRKARRENSADSRLLGTTSLRFALHGWKRRSDPLLPGQRWQSQCFQVAVVPFLRHGTLVLQRL
ncbi:hypothetical protein [Thiolapillus sp.]|uniref:hypothetical protein n=1 Tax=Thiolapillus sp. TaxID=2017437 RepID=UPI003AF853E6